MERKTPYFCGFIYVLEKEIVVIFPLTSCKPPLKRAFGSISSVWANISPLMTAVAFRTSLALTCMEPSTSPNISAFAETMFPVTFPFGPITIFTVATHISFYFFHPVGSLFPSRCRLFTVVPAARVLCRPPFVFSSFCFIPIMFRIVC